MADVYEVSLVYGLCTLCHDLFAPPLGVIGRLCSVIVALSVHLLYYFEFNIS